MIPGVNIFIRKVSVASINKTWGRGWSRGHSEPLSGSFRGEGESPLRTFLNSKKYLDWFNAEEINVNGNIYAVLKLRVEQATYESKI